jgi:hypothetical protein
VIDRIAEKARQGFCPVCGKGPFRLLAKHTSGAHEIFTKELHDMLGLTLHDALCDPNLSKFRSEKAKREGLPDYNEGRSTMGRKHRATRRLVDHARKVGFQSGVQNQHRYVQPKHVVKHGTAATYMHGCRCEMCKSAIKERRDRFWEDYRRKVASDPSLLQHGKLWTYQKLRCRCNTCSDVSRQYQRKYQQIRKLRDKERRG